MLGRCRSALILVSSMIVCGALAPGAAAAGSSVGQDLQPSKAFTDETRDTMAVSRRSPRTARLRLRGGKVITVWRFCAMRKDIGGKNRAAEAEADKLDPLEQVLTARKTALQRFLDAHPEQSLPSDLYRRYTELRGAYSLARSRFNAQVDRYNAAADRYNDALESCKV